MEHHDTGLVKAVKNDLGQIKNIIESSLMYDWAIKIEYAVTTTANITTWSKWDKTFFAITDSGQVLEKIMECCRNNPDCSMKLVCEHFRPDYQLIYYFHGH
ncbi:MAG: ribulose bisphosphate carboxylase small subunit [Chromatiales bacterium]|jgi:ribulose bisphosphate carboxylase small subunit